MSEWFKTSCVLFVDESKQSDVRESLKTQCNEVNNKYLRIPVTVYASKSLAQYLFNFYLEVPKLAWAASE